MKLLYILFLSILLSCTHEYEGQVCGKESQAGFTVHNFSELWTIKGDINNDSFSCAGTYILDAEHINPRYCTWAIYSRLRDICNTDIPQIEFSVKLKTLDSSVLVYGLFNDVYVDRNGRHYLPLSSNDGINFYGKVDFRFDKITFESKDVFTSINVRLLIKGDLRSDSARFFPIFESMSCTIKAHKPE